MTDTPRPTAESPTLNKAARALLDDYTATRTGGIHPAKMAARLLEVEVEAAALSDSALRKFVEFVADWAHDCNDTDLDAAGFSEPPDATFYGFDKVEKDARALLAQPTPDDKPSEQWEPGHMDTAKVNWP